MPQIRVKAKAVAAIGEEIGFESGAQMIREFQKFHPADIQSYTIGKTILQQILAQPGCEGIEFYNAINEHGEKTLVYVGVDQYSKPLIKIQYVGDKGSLITENAIVADRVRPTGVGADEIHENDWMWLNE